MASGCQVEKLDIMRMKRHLFKANIKEVKKRRRRESELCCIFSFITQEEEEVHEKEVEFILSLEGSNLIRG